MIDIDPWLQVAAALMSSGSFAVLVQLGRGVLKRRAAKQYDRGYGNIRKIYQLLQSSMPELRANRLMILKSENGGGIPAPGAHVTSSVINEVMDPPVCSVFEAWQKVPLDQHCSRMVAEVITNGSASAAMVDLREASTLRDLMVTAESSHVFYYRICATPNALLYLSIHYASTDDQPMGERERVTARRVVHQLCGIFSKHHQLIKTDS